MLSGILEDEVLRHHDAVVKEGSSGDMDEMALLEGGGGFGGEAWGDDGLVLEPSPERALAMGEDEALGDQVRCHVLIIANDLC